jgi:hypothetical protein
MAHSGNIQGIIREPSRNIQGLFREQLAAQGDLLLFL